MQIMSVAHSVTAQLLRERIESIAAILKTSDDALGSLALGSLGKECERLDAWSDWRAFPIHHVDLSGVARALAKIWHRQLNLNLSARTRSGC